MIFHDHLFAECEHIKSCPKPRKQISCRQEVDLCRVKVLPESVTVRAASRGKWKMLSLWTPTCTQQQLNKTVTMSFALEHDNSIMTRVSVSTISSLLPREERGAFPCLWISLMCWWFCFLTFMPCFNKRALKEPLHSSPCVLLAVFGSGRVGAEIQTKAAGGKRSDAPPRSR